MIKVTLTSDQSFDQVRHNKNMICIIMVMYPWRCVHCDEQENENKWQVVTLAKPYTHRNITHVSLCIHTYTHMHTHKYKHTRMHAHTYTPDTHTHITHTHHTHTHTSHTHTHTHTPDTHITHTTCTQMYRNTYRLTHIQTDTHTDWHTHRLALTNINSVISSSKY